jgi:hypothetical protein
MLLTTIIIKKKNFKILKKDWLLLLFVNSYNNLLNLNFDISVINRYEQVINL